MTARKRAFAAFVAGLLFALGQPPFDLWMIALPSLVGFLWLVQDAASPKQGGLLSWLFGTAYFGASMHWIVEPFFVDAAVTGWMAPFALIGLAGGLALFWGAAGWTAVRLSRDRTSAPFPPAKAHAPASSIQTYLGGSRGGPAVPQFSSTVRPAVLVAAPVAFAAAELLRGYILTGFPWGSIGYVLAPTGLVHLAAFVGPYGLGLIALGLAASAATLRSLGVLASVVAFVLLWAGGAALAPNQAGPEGRPIVRVVQPNAPQHLKWDPDHARTFFFRAIEATEAGDPPDLIVWPETALPIWLHAADEALAIMTDAARGTPLIVGAQRVEGDDYFNSAVLLGATGAQEALYDKHHLVPFGEYIPLAHLFTGIEAGGIAARARGGYTAGPGPSLMQTPIGSGLPLICYEAVFPQDLRGTESRPDFLLHLTNDAWFGEFAGPQQHLMQARLRAIETGLPLIRAANTGISTVIAPDGTMADSLPLGTDGYLDLPLPVPAPQTLYARTGDTPLAILLALVLAALALRPRRA